MLAQRKATIRTAYAEFTSKPQEEYGVVAYHVVR